MPYLWTAIIGFLGGISSGLFGVGGGVLFVPLMILLLKFESHLAIGTSLAVIVPTALIAAFRNFHAGMIDWRTALILSLFAIGGAWLGVGLSLKIEAESLKRYYAIFLMILSLKMFFQK
ncbi:MAG: sulfite exporter TauE/SafE family protein [Candidatus Omnitrophica bacterium]|nr:sulfite exporter TauE/SafE family protein [Candidatus Omnitrophota bacterium]